MRTLLFCLWVALCISFYTTTWIVCVDGFVAPTATSGARRIKWTRQETSPRQRRQRREHSRTRIDATTEHSDQDESIPFATSSESYSYLYRLLEEYGWGNRLLTLSDWTLPMWAEVQRDGTTQVVQIQTLECSSDGKAPKLVVEQSLVMNSSSGEETRMESFKVDIGQLTTIWTDKEGVEDGSGKGGFSVEEVSASSSSSILEISGLSLRHVDQTMDRLYDDRQSTSGGGKKSGWTKKQLNQKIDQSPRAIGDRTHTEAVLRAVYKAGPHQERLVDSTVVADAFWNNSNRDKHLKQLTPLERRVAAATLIHTFGGGRFKRMPCLLVQNSSTDANESSSKSLTVVNGGWLVVDAAVRAASEARALVETGHSRGTSADERIVQRLEEFALSTKRNGHRHRHRQEEEQDLQVDVRETLRGMDLQITPHGANQALVQLGIWSDQGDTSKNGGNGMPQPWSPKVLQAVEWYQAMDQKRQSRFLHQEQDNSNLEGRVDLRYLPCVCIDAARTTFRDDAIGVRSRSSTGRKVSTSSKWELLIHIADVSDLYAPMVTSRAQQLTLLQEAAANRGSSRYDLEGGPLHLLPPSLLGTLGMKSLNPDFSRKQKVVMDKDSHATNRCVTLWVYVDEQTGKVLDTGVERTLISAPLALSFQSASDLMDGKLSSGALEDPALGKAKAILAVVERDLELWRDYQRENNSVAKSRETRLEARAMVDKQIYGNQQGTDDGRAGFQRTRGHRLVDTCLEVHGYAMNGLLKRAKANIPHVAGTQRDGRVATAPLRRYIDGMAQRQALAVLCGYGGEPMSNAECAQVGLRATKAINAISNIRATKKASASKSSSRQQQQAVRALRHQMSNNNQEHISAISTGKQSEVVILGVGAVATCRGIKGTIKAGQKLTVLIQHIDEQEGKVTARLVEIS